MMEHHARQFVCMSVHVQGPYWAMRSSRVPRATALSEGMLSSRRSLLQGNSLVTADSSTYPPITLLACRSWCNCLRSRLFLADKAGGHVTTQTRCVFKGSSLPACRSWCSWQRRRLVQTFPRRLPCLEALSGACRGTCS